MILALELMSVLRPGGRHHHLIVRGCRRSVLTDAMRRKRARSAVQRCPASTSKAQVRRNALKFLRHGMQNFAYCIEPVSTSHKCFATLLQSIRVQQSFVMA